MANFSQKIKTKYDMNTYEGTKAEVDRIILSLKKLNLSYQKPKVDFLFDIGDVSCSCKSLEEFTEIAYGQIGYRLTSFSIIQFKIIDICAYISSSGVDELHISSSDKNTLEKLILCLNEENTENINDDIKKSSAIKQWIVAIMQNLLANWIWICIVAMCTFLAAIFAGK